MTLILPVEIGKTYRRRDGKAVVARPDYWGQGAPRAYVGDHPQSRNTDREFVFCKTGWVSLVEESPIDLVDGPLAAVSITDFCDGVVGKNKPNALDTQEGGDHYRTMGLQPWEAFEHWLTPEQHKGYLLGTALAYLARYNSAGEGKGGMVDVKKARHCLQRMEEIGNELQKG